MCFVAALLELAIYYCCSREYVQWISNRILLVWTKFLRQPYDWALLGLTQGWGVLKPFRYFLFFSALSEQGLPSLSHAWVWKPADLGHGIQRCGYHGPSFAYWIQQPNLHICSSESVRVYGIHAISGDSRFVIDAKSELYVPFIWLF